MITQAMILAAGFGKRMRPLTDRIPKPLVEVRGKSLLDHSVESLIKGGIQKIVINAHHLSPQIHDKILSYRARYPDVTFIYSHEDEILETGGGILNALPHLGQEPFFVVNGDIYTEEKTDLSLLSEMQKAYKPDYEILLCVIDKNGAFGYQGPGDFDFDPSPFLTTHNKDRAYILSGIYITKASFFDNAPADKVFSMTTLFNQAVDKKVLFGFDGSTIIDWYHIGTMQDLEKFNEKAA